MGTVFVEVAGSFNETGRATFSAEDGGHTMALHRAIAFLERKIPGAIIQDHALHDAGDHPMSAFGKLPDPRPEGLREP